MDKNMNMVQDILIKYYNECDKELKTAKIEEYPNILEKRGIIENIYYDILRGYLE